MTGGFHTACETPGCGRPRNLGQEMCFACWRLLPRDRRDAIMAAQRGGRFRDRAALGQAAREWIAGYPPGMQAGRIIGERPG